MKLVHLFLAALASIAPALAQGNALELQTSLAVRGGTLQVRCEGAPAGADVWFVRGRPAGQGNGPVVIGNQVLSVEGPAQIGSVTADAQGRVLRELAIPAGAPLNQQFALQAVVVGVGSSNLVERWVRPRGNMLILVADDLGVDRLALYGTGDPATIPPTPHLDQLAAQGLTFQRGYSQPNCSPTRASLLTGRQPWRTGVGTALSFHGMVSLPFSELTMPEMLDQRTGAYAHAAVGKWHVSSKRHGGFDNPNLQGFDWYGGSMVGFGSGNASDGLPQSYFDWEKVTNGSAARTSSYATSENANDAIARMAAMPEPWLLYVAFNAPHAPYHFPPANLWSGTRVGGTPASRKYNAMVEAMDSEIGRILAGLSADVAARTTIVFVGDNGTPTQPIEDPFIATRSKGTVYEGGIHVPFIVKSPLLPVVGQTSDALVHAADIFPTLAELAGAPLSELELTEIDGRSLVPVLLEPTARIRETVMSELFRSPGFDPHWEYLRALQDDRWKLLQTMGQPDQLYDMAGVWLEGEDLLADGILTPEQLAAYQRLLSQLPGPMQ